MRAAGSAGNRQLTALVAAILVLLLAIEGATLLRLGSLLTVHAFVGMLLIPIVALKLASTGWRMLQYYLGADEYTRHGPPPLLLRALVAPVLIVSTVVLFATGTALLVLDQTEGTLVGLHKASFIVWLGAAAGFLVQVTIAMLAGGLLSRLPDTPVKIAVAVLFAIGAVILWRQRDDPTDTAAVDASGTVSRGRIVGVSFTTLVVAEVGDLTQLTIASLAASTGQPVAVFLGGLLALWSVAALAAVGGMAVLKRVPIRAVRTGAAIVFGVLSVVTLIEAFA